MIRSGVSGKTGRIRLKGEALFLLRVACLQRDGGRCRQCGVLVRNDFPEWHPLKYHMAHIQGRGAGGSDVLENVKSLCGRCHWMEHQPKAVPRN